MRASMPRPARRQASAGARAAEPRQGQHDRRDAGEQDERAEQEGRASVAPSKSQAQRFASGGFRKTKAATSPAGRRFSAQIQPA